MCIFCLSKEQNAQSNLNGGYSKKEIITLLNLIIWEKKNFLQL